MSGKYATPLLLDPGYSRVLRVWLMLVHVVALILVPFLSLSLWPGLILVLVVLLSLWRSMRLYISMASPDAVTSVEWFESHVCSLRLASGEAVRTQLLPQAFILSWLVIMYFRSDSGRRYHLLLLPDMLERKVFRRLRVRLMIELNESLA